MPQVINTVTKAAPTDNYPVVFDTDLSGSYRIVANLTVRDAIVSTQRKQGMLVFVLSDLHFYSLQSDLLTWTDIGLSLGGFAPPIVRYIYLVADASDALRMGGTANNTYLTFQTAYNAAVALQTASGGKVVIQVGNTTAAVVGNMTTATAWNINISMVGISSAVSAVGTIIITNVTGANNIKLDNITTGNITLATQANIVMNNSVIGAIVANRVFASGLLTLQGNNNITGSINASSATATLPVPINLSFLYNSTVGDITMDTVTALGQNINIVNCANLVVGNIAMRNTSATGTFSIGILTFTTSKNISVASLTQTMVSNNNTGGIGGLIIGPTNQNIFFAGLLTIAGYAANASSDVVITNLTIYNTFFNTDVLINSTAGNVLSTAVRGGRIASIDINNCQFQARASFVYNTTTLYAGAGSTCSVRNSSFVRLSGNGGLLFCIENVSLNSFRVSNCIINDSTSIYGLTITSLGVAANPYLINTGTNSIILEDLTVSSSTINYYGDGSVMNVPDISISKVTFGVLNLIFNTVDCYYALVNSVADSFSAIDATATVSGVDSRIEVSKVNMFQSAEGMPSQVRSSYIKGTLADGITYIFYVYSSTLDFSEGGGGNTYDLAGDLYTSNLIRKATSSSTMTNNNSFEQLV